MSDDPLEGFRRRLPDDFDEDELKPEYGQLTFREVLAVKKLAGQLLRRSLMTAMLDELPHSDATPPVRVGALWIRNIKTLESFYRNRIVAMAGRAKDATEARIDISVGELTIKLDLKRPGIEPLFESWKGFALGVATAIGTRVKADDLLVVIRSLSSSSWRMRVWFRDQRSGKKDDWQYRKYDDPMSGQSFDDSDDYVLRLAMASSKDLAELIKELSAERKERAYEVAQQKIRSRPDRLKRLYKEAIARYQKAKEAERKELQRKAAAADAERRRIAARDGGDTPRPNRRRPMDDDNDETWS